MATYSIDSTQDIDTLANQVAVIMPIVLLIIVLLAIWTIIWKGLALWHAARHGQGWWFGILLIINTAGILEIIYLFAVLKLKFNQLFSKT
jgi:methionyl-tRNA synthetase